MVLFLALAALVDWGALIIKGVFPVAAENFNFIQLGSYISFYCNAVSNIFLARFIGAIFLEKKSKALLHLLMVLEFSVGPLFFVLFFLSEYNIYTNADLELLGLMVHVASAFIIYFLLFGYSIKIYRRIRTDPTKIVESNGIKFIGFSSILLFSAVLSFVLHEIFIELDITTIEYILPTLGWLLGAFAAIIIYIGYITPDWIKQRWLSKSA